MKQKLIILLALLLIAALLPGCGKKQESVPETVRISVLNSTTGFGMAKLMEDNSNGTASQKYEFSIESDASNITSALINGSVDIAALPTNAAATLYNKTQGKIQVLALNTLGVLYVVTTGGQNITSLSDLDGKTVYCPAQNPEYIIKTLCDNAKINVTTDTLYAQPAALKSAVENGQVEIAVLPEPMVTMVKSVNQNVKTVIDITEEWERAFGENTLVQGCVVVRTEFAKANPETVNKFLSEYEKSINYLNTETHDACELIAKYGIFAKAAVAEKAVPFCNICFISGKNMKADFSKYLECLYNANPAYVGNKLPEDNFYYE